MSVALLLLFLHIAVMFAAISVALGTNLFFRVAYMSGQVAAVRGVAMVAQRAGPLIPILFVVGGLLGLLTAINFGLNLLAPWLVIAYLLWVVAMILGFTGSRAFGPKIGKALATAPDGPITPELQAVVSEQRYRLESTLEYLIIVAVIFDMVVKPFNS
jgi:hypothetical protein